MSSGARTAILARLRAAQRTARLPEVEGPPRGIEPTTATAEECLARFRQELSLLGVESHVEASPEAVRERVSSLVAGQRVLSWDPERLPYGAGELASGATLGRDSRDEQARAEMGLIAVDGAIAETGSLAVLSGKGQARTASLLPPAMVAVVRRADLHFSMGEFFDQNVDRMSRAACCTFITGPSRTADIELQLTVGVHGPGRVTVVIGP